MTPDAIRSLAALLRCHGTGQPLSPRGPTEEGYARVLNRLRGADVLGGLRGVDFRPCLLLNGLLVASQQDDAAARLTCRALALGLDTFAEYFAHRSGGAPGFDAEREQRRYFAFVLAQFPEVGAPLDAALATMKADALDQGTAYEVREIFEGGPDALLRSSLFEEDERAAWRRIFDGERGAREALRELLAQKWSLPLERAGASA